jgi:hypothetical protein
MKKKQYNNDMRKIKLLAVECVELCMEDARERVMNSPKEESFVEYTKNLATLKSLSEIFCNLYNL